jgi:sodium transport system permease protein
VSGFLDQVGPVFRKEWLDAIRDRRSLTSALIFPLLAPLMINLMFGTLAGQERNAEDMVIHVQGAEHAPGLIEWIERANHEVVETEGDLFEAVRAGDLDLAVLIDADYAKDFAKGVPSSVSLIVNGSKSDLLPLNLRARNIIESYAAHTSALRLIARGVSPDLRAPLQLEELDVATIEQRSATFLIFIPVLIILAAFASGMNVAIDTTAGERERGSLEALLLNPVSREAIVVGKWLVTVTFASAGIVMVLATTLLALQQTSLEDLGIRMDVGVLDFVVILAGVLPLTLLASGFQLLVSTFARSFKEAQTYVSLLMFLPMIPFGIASLSGLPTDLWMAAIPSLGQHMIVTQVLGGENPGLPMFLVAGVASMLLGLLCVVLTARLFQHERIVFGATN